jgi:fused signal recognition particle receptor
VGVFDMFKKKADAPPQPPAERAGQGRGAAPQPEQPAQQQNLFGMLRGALKKTSDLLNTDVRDLFKRQGRLVDDEFLGELYAILVKTDMGTGPAGRIRDRIGTDFRARIVHMEDVLQAVKDELRDLIAQPEYPVKLAASGPTIILVVGVNGSGKTTSIAKLMWPASYSVACLMMI